MSIVVTGGVFVCVQALRAFKEEGFNEDLTKKEEARKAKVTHMRCTEQQQQGKCIPDPEWR